MAAVLLWSTVATAFKLALKQLDFLQLLLVSSCVSLICLFLISASQSKLIILKSYSLKEYFRSALMAILNPFLYYIVLFKAYSMLPAQEAQPLNYTWPIMLVLLSIPLLGQKIGVRSILAVIICFIGVFIISTQGNVLEFRFSNATGAILALSTAVIWALFWILNMKDDRDEVLKLLLSFFFGFIYIIITVLGFSEVPLKLDDSILAAGYVGIFEMGLCFVLWSKALQLSDSTAMVSKLVYLVPVMSLVFIYFILGEKILSSTMIGLLVILAGIILERRASYKAQFS